MTFLVLLWFLSYPVFDLLWKGSVSVRTVTLIGLLFVASVRICHMLLSCSFRILLVAFSSNLRTLYPVITDRFFFSYLPLLYLTNSVQFPSSIAIVFLTPPPLKYQQLTFKDTDYPAKCDAKTFSFSLIIYLISH